MKDRARDTNSEVMSPGVNDGPRNTGTLPKSNRRSDRNRERSAANQQMANQSSNHGRAQQQHSNNLFQLDWQPVSDRETLRTTKNSNTRSVSSFPSTSYQEISDFVSHSSGRHCNYSVEECTPWSKMVLPTDSQAQSPPCLQGAKPSNVDKMPDRNQVESRLNQIRDYIRVTSTMMDSLSQSSDPRAQTQNEKLSRMVEDLRDSETKLAKLLETYDSHGITNQNGESGKEDGDENIDTSREMILRRKMEDSQRKLAQLQERHASLIGMQIRVRETLNEARQAQQALLQQENQSAGSSTWEGNNRSAPLPANVEELESETAALRGKLAQLQSKKKHMDHLVAELQAVEMSDRGSCSSEGSRNTSRDKAAELEAMKAQLNHLKALMEEAKRVRECLDFTAEPEADVNVNGDGTEEGESQEEGASLCITSNTMENQIDSDDTVNEKTRNSVHRPTVEEVQAVTRELKEQSAILQATRAEIQRLKQPLMASAVHPPPVSIFTGSTPPSSLIGAHMEKKQSNNVGDVQPTQAKKRQIEDFVNKDQGQASNMNRNAGGTDLNSHRSSNSRISHSGTPTNVWLPAAAPGGSNEQSIDGISENLMDIGPQPPAIENGFTGNYWGFPPAPMNQLQYGSAEYYRNLLLNSQVQQLQMMGTTIQQCCQLLWAQQRELQSMRSAITQLQLQLRHNNQTTQRNNNTENQEDYSNLSRSVHHLADTLDSALPPSSSLPNLVSLPNTSPALSHSAVGTSVNSQQHQQQQLNNQVPPGNRANNYWDNFRSYSRQNLLSGNVKTMTDPTTGPISNSTTSANTASSAVNTSIVKDKRNRDQGTDNLPLPSLAVAETQYSLNPQQQSNLQQQERESTATRSNIITNEVSQQVDNLWEEAHSSFRFPHATNDDHFLHNLSPEMREVIGSLVMANKKRPDYLVTILKEIKTMSEDKRFPLLLRNLRSLQDQPSNNIQNEAADQTGSDSCRSSDEDSDVGAILGFNLENQSSSNELVVSAHAGTSSSPLAQVPLIDHLEMPASLSPDNANVPSSTSALKPGCNEDLAEADQSRPECSDNVGFEFKYCRELDFYPDDSEEMQDDVALSLGSAQGTSKIESDNEEMVVKAEYDRAVDTMVHTAKLFQQYHH